MNNPSMERVRKKVNHPIILPGVREEQAAGEEIASVDNIKVYNAFDKFSLNESADLVRKSKLVVTHDTELMHIAAAYKKKIISLWGNKVPSFGMTPYYGDASVQNTILQVNKLWCRPCSKIGYDKCPLGYFKCMQKTENGTVLDSVRQLV